MALIAWDQICKPKMDGGLGIKSVRSVNKALLAKKGWIVYHDNKEWGSIWKHKYLFTTPSLDDFLSYPIVPSSSTIIWGVVQGAKNILIKGCIWQVGNGHKIRFWDDMWLLYHPLIDVNRVLVFLWRIIGLIVNGTIFLKVIWFLPISS